MRKSAFCENKFTDQLHGNHAAAQRLCFRYIVQFLNPKFQASSHLLHLQLGLFQTWPEIPKTGFLMKLLTPFSSHKTEMAIILPVLVHNDLQFSLPSRRNLSA